MAKERRPAGVLLVAQKATEAMARDEAVEKAEGASQGLRGPLR